MTDFGLRIYTLRDAGADKRYFRVTNFVMPNLSAFGGSTVGDGYAVHWHVPIDDTHHWKYLFMFSRTRHLDPSSAHAIAPNSQPIIISRVTRVTAFNRTASRCRPRPSPGLGINFQAHDAFATESQGPVQDRTQRECRLVGQSYRGSAQVDLERDQRREGRQGAAPCDSRSESEPAFALGGAFRCSCPRLWTGRSTSKNSQAGNHRPKPGTIKFIYENGLNESWIN